MKWAGCCSYYPAFGARKRPPQLAAGSHYAGRWEKERRSRVGLGQISRCQKAARVCMSRVPHSSWICCCCCCWGVGKQDVRVSREISSAKYMLQGHLSSQRPEPEKARDAQDILFSCSGTIFKILPNEVTKRKSGTNAPCVPHKGVLFATRDIVTVAAAEGRGCC